MSEEIEEKPHIELPFDEEKLDLGEWVYQHRVALCISIIIYLVAAIIFVAAKISLITNNSTNVIAIDLNMQQLEELERQRDELKKSVEELQQQKTQDWAKVQNRVSNANSTERSEVRDDRNTDVDQLLKDAAEFQERMAANKSAYESGVAEAKAIKERAKENTEDKQDKSERKDTNIKGNVTVTYSFDKPVRHSQRLTVPAYQCEGGGEVVVQVTINTNGDVISAKIGYGGDSCMQNSAIQAAKASKFSVNSSAPSRQTGVITYLFIPQ